jgi:hypothetical protein
MIVHFTRLELMLHFSAQSHRQSRAVCNLSRPSVLVKIFPPFVSSANFIFSETTSADIPTLVGGGCWWRR